MQLARLQQRLILGSIQQGIGQEGLEIAGPQGVRRALEFQQGVRPEILQPARQDLPGRWPATRPAPSAAAGCRFAAVSGRRGLLLPDDSSCPVASAAGWPAAGATRCGFSWASRLDRARSVGTAAHSWLQSSLAAAPRGGGAKSETRHPWHTSPGIVKDNQEPVQERNKAIVGVPALAGLAKTG